MWPLYEKFLRGVAGLGKLDEHAGHSRRYDVEHRRARVLVVGGGRAGRAAAVAAANLGPGRRARRREPAQRERRRIDGVEVIAPARALGIWEGGLVPVDCGTVLYRYRAERIVVATGALEQPLVFPGNDLVGVMLPKRRSAFGSRLLGQARRARGGPRRRRPRSRGRRRPPRRGRRGPARRRSPGGAARADRGARPQGPRPPRRPRRDAASNATCSSPPPAASPSYSLLAQAGARVEYEPDARDLRPDATCPTASRRRARSRARAARRLNPFRAADGKDHVDKSLRLRLRGRDDEGRRPRGRRGVRLDRALEAVHDRDDGAVPGEAVPARVDPALRARDGRERGGGRDDDGAAAVGAGRARPPRRAALRAGAPHLASTSGTRRQARG